MSNVFANVQALRAIAALLVFVGHLFPNSALFWVGPTGVDIFFVISGFIITLTTKPDLARFARRRFLRIYPQYWLALAFAFLVDPFIPLAPNTTPPRHPLELVLLATPENGKVAVAWTLAYEIYFYCVVGLLLTLLGKRWLRGVVIWMALQIVVVAAVDPQLHYVVPLSPLIFEFGLGCLLAYLYRRGYALPPLFALLAGLAWYAGGIAFNYTSGHYYPLPRVLCFGPAAALIVHALVTWEPRVTLPRPLVALGDASYSLYLWHQMIFIIGAALLPDMPWLWAAVALGVGISQIDARMTGRTGMRHAIQPAHE